MRRSLPRAVLKCVCDVQRGILLLLSGVIAEKVGRQAIYCSLSSLSGKHMALRGGEGHLVGICFYESKSMDREMDEQHKSGFTRVRACFSSLAK